MKAEFIKNAGEAEEVQDQALETRAKTCKLVGQGEKAKILQNLHRIEGKKRTFIKLKCIFKELHWRRLSSVLTLKEKEEEDKPDEWVRVTNNEEIQQLIRSHNKQHFNQTLETPMKDSQTIQMLGWDSSSGRCLKIIQGKKPENLPKQLNSTIALTMFKQFQVAILRWMLTFPTRSSRKLLQNGERWQQHHHQADN